MKNILKTAGKISRIAANITGWSLGIILTAYGAYRLSTDMQRLKPVDIVEATIATEKERKIDRVAHNTQDYFKKAAQRQRNMLLDQFNDSTYADFLKGFDTLRLMTVAEKVAAVDSIVDAAIAPASDLPLYGETRWATPIETALHRRGDADDAALLKADVLHRLGVPLRDIFISVATYKPDAPPVTSVMVNIAAADAPENLVIIDSDKKTAVTPLADKAYAYHIGINENGIRYITPPLTAGK